MDTRPMKVEPLADAQTMQPGNLFPQWGPIIPVLSHLPIKAAQVLVHFVEPESVCSGGAEFATGWPKIGAVVGTTRQPTLWSLAVKGELPVYRPTSGARFGGGGQVKSPLSQLIRWLHTNEPSRLLELGIECIDW